MTAVGLSVLVHAALLALAMRSPPGSLAFPEADAVMVSLSADDLASAPELPQRPTPKTPAALALNHQPLPPAQATAEESLQDPASFLAAQDPEIDTAAVSAAVAAAASASQGQPCQLSSWLQKALEADPQVASALPKIPRPALSVASAVMLWDGRWVDIDSRAVAQISIIRAALVAGVDAAPPACRDLLVRGPELLTLTSGSSATVIAIGSGEWRWTDLLATPYPSARAPRP